MRFLLRLMICLLKVAVLLVVSFATFMAIVFWLPPFVMLVVYTHKYAEFWFILLTGLAGMTAMGIWLGKQLCPFWLKAVPSAVGDLAREQGGVSRSRRRLQFSLRSLLLFMVALCVLFSWFPVMYHHARRESAAMAVVKRAGGSASGWGDVVPSLWMRERFGDDFCWRATSVSFLDSGITDSKLVMLIPHLKRLRHLEGLGFQGTEITDEGLRTICLSLPWLSMLKLQETDISDNGMQYLLEVRRLEFLDLSGTQVTDTSIPTLSKLHDLDYLSLDKTAITDEGCRRLRRALPNCKIGHYVPLTVGDSSD
ncbi:MAG: hypothetical protein JW888_16605 [Pirellulales bacterium]|nr:hypothetical protein [Pirellulales bacterium]